MLSRIYRDVTNTIYFEGLLGQVCKMMVKEVLQNIPKPVWSGYRGICLT